MTTIPLIFKDDHPANTPQDIETVMVAITGPCGGDASADVTVHNVGVTVAATVEPTRLTKGIRWARS